ncbi:hypothetical protein BDQ12DRAFT_726834 [Crucibulum laeve]|uniref:F-box domain-containing protein n=1 Tax=Crucibulum laeve TaxID=68775 RepID=A0A5C3LMM0_9AGAR|nr:hypothetical protein BDQ12DRAFT_726834 [Crucibulum laeve]
MARSTSDSPLPEVTRNINEALPPEILSNIFIFCLPFNELCSPTLQTAPLLVGQVCRHWRRIAGKCPQLWSSVSFTFPRRGTKRSLIRFGRWIRRSKSLPLSVHFDAIYSGAVDVDEFLNTVVIPNTHRFRHIALSFRSGGILLSRLSDMHSSEFPILESISLCDNEPLFDKSVVDNSALTPWSIFTGPPPPLLKIFQNKGLPFRLDEMNLPWNQMQELKLDQAQLTITEFFSLFEKCPMLQFLFVGYIHGEQNTCLTTPEHLRWREPLKSTQPLSTDIYILSIYTLNFLPHEDNFTNDERWEWSSRKFRGFMVASRCKLQSLSIDYPPNDFLRLLTRHGQSITELSFGPGWNARIIDKFLKRMSAMYDPTIVPNLTHFAFKGYNHSDELLLALIKSRFYYSIDSVVNLKSVSVDYTFTENGIPKEIEKQYDLLFYDDLEVDIIDDEDRGEWEDTEDEDIC